MEYYIVEDNQVVKKYKKECGKLIFLEVINDKLESIRHLDKNTPFYNLIKRNKYLDLYYDKPLIEDELPENTFYSVKIPLNTPHERDNHEMNWNDYHHIDVIERWMDSLEVKFPSICTVFDIGTTLEGRTLKVLKVSNSSAGNSPVWLDAGIHAREWIAPAVNTFIADYIVRNFKSLPECFTNKDWYFLPVANPDGYDYSRKVERMWRKNRAWYGGQCHGVDLNRNFSFAWGGINSSSDPTSQLFRGRGPFSEFESSAMRRQEFVPLGEQNIRLIIIAKPIKSTIHSNLISHLRHRISCVSSFIFKDALQNSGIKFKVYVTLHSYGQVITFPFGYRNELCSDYIRLLQGATVMSKAIFASTGNTYKVGISKDVMYGASGTSTDWSYGAAHIPYCYLIELRSKTHKFNLPREEIQETCNEILNCIKALMEFVDDNSNS